MKLRISRLADRDIERIWQFIARESPTAATKVEDDIHTAMKLLADHPQMGHQRKDVSDDRYRFWPVYSYIIAYRCEEESLIVVRVVHGARNIRRLLRRHLRP
ncbi:MAG TPA: type II toxin-antitoxin system RelE/ParE family toxin [Tepidisphaeraceae bacterium]|jgi:antitoxin ParD1/3/4/toxin ParE1/3/4|nr:type II toxin-antitoxin system RelE/ParE family toxin [Tepidisphaeraceae bacterium]